MKNSMLKTVGVLIISAAILLVSVGCVEEDRYDKYSGTSTSSGESGNINFPNFDNKEENLPSQDETSQETVSETINPLTGKPCTSEVASARPVVFMLNNLKEALPQVGISEAAVVYEVLAEGGITRLVAVYNDYKDIKEIGSVRSARDYCIDLADAHDAIFAHAGQSESAKKVIISRGTNNINGDYMYRSKERLKTMSYEHTLMMSGKNLVEAIKAKGYRSTTDKKQPLSFYESEITPKGSKASYVEIPFTMAKKDNPYAVSFFNFDENTGVYKKGQYGLDHIDGDDGKALSFKNVIILECAHSSTGDAEGHINVNFTGTGKGKYITMGKCQDIVWKKTSRTSSYTLYESDGKTPHKLNPGKSYIGIVPTGSNITIE